MEVMVTKTSETSQEVAGEAAGRKGGLRQVLEGMSLAFDPEAAAGLQATIQFDVTGAEPGHYYLDIANGECTFRVGRAATPSLAIATPSGTWLDIAHGTLDPREAALRGLYRANGDLGLLFRLSSLFRPADAVKVAAPAGQRPPGPLALSGMTWMALVFVPTTLFWALFNVPGVSPWLSVGLPFALSLALVAYRLIYGRPTWLEAGVCAMFALFGAAALTGWPALTRWGGAFGSILMGGIWLSALVFNDLPVSAEYVKWGFVRRLWGLSLFIHPNAVISLAWGAQFLAAGALGMAAVLLPPAHLPLVLAQYLLLVPAARFTQRYQAGANRRRIADVEGELARVRLAAIAGLVIGAGMVVAACVWL